LFYSRRPKKLGYEAGCTHAEIVCVTATNATGSYEFQGVSLPSRGGNFWDGHSVFISDVVRLRENYYPSYTGNRGTTNWTAEQAVGRVVVASQQPTHRRGSGRFATQTMAAIRQAVD